MRSQKACECQLFCPTRSILLFWKSVVLFLCQTPTSLPGLGRMRSASPITLPIADNSKIPVEGTHVPSRWESIGQGRLLSLQTSAVLWVRVCSLGVVLVGSGLSC